MNNQKLRELYDRNKGAIYDVGGRCNGHMEGPFLIAPPDRYWRSRVRVAFVGQQTKGWSCEAQVAQQMDAYREFNLGSSYYSSPFWSVVRKLEEALVGVTYSAAWLNFNRYDQDADRPSPQNEETLSELDFLVLEELKLVSPDVTVFLTGPGFYPRVDRLLQAELVSIGTIPARQLCRIQSQRLDGLIFRTYHPNYLRQARLERKVIDTIVQLVQGYLPRNPSRHPSSHRTAVHTRPVV